MKLLVTLFFLACSQAANIFDNPELLYQMPLGERSILEQKITINWRFASFNEFVTTLQKNYALNSKVVGTTATPTLAVLLYLNSGTLRQLITQASSKFGYNWAYQDGVVIFSAINPIIATKNLSFYRQSSWELTPRDKTLKAVLAKWCKLVNWQLVWNVHADYPIATSWTISGYFETAINEILRASQVTDVPLRAIMYEANHVIEVTAANSGGGIR